MLMTDQSQDKHRDPPASGPLPRQITSAELLQGAREVWIRHGEELYRLRHTRSGKLILQK